MTKQSKPNPFIFLINGTGIKAWLGLVVLFFIGWYILPIFSSFIPKMTPVEIIWTTVVIATISIVLLVDRILQYDDLYKDK